MAFEKGIKIDRDFILSRVREEDIFERYFGSVKFDNNVVNYSRDDPNPGCRFYIHKKTGRIRFKDFSRGYNWDCFEAAQQTGQTKDLPFKKLLNTIAQDFNLLGRVITEEQKLVIKKSYEERIEIANNVVAKKIVITHPSKQLNWKQRNYWDRYEVTQQDLDRFYVYNFRDAYIKYWYADGTTHLGPIYSSKNELKFAYYLGEGEYKLYFPDRKKKDGKFLQVRGDLIQGWHQLPVTGEFVIITKSYKDVIVLDTMDFPAISPSSENVVLPKNKLEELFIRFDRVYILFDNDRAGQKAALTYLVEYPNLTPIMFADTQPKDVSDNVEEYSREVIKELLLPQLAA